MIRPLSISLSNNKNSPLISRWVLALQNLLYSVGSHSVVWSPAQGPDSRHFVNLQWVWRSGLLGRGCHTTWLSSIAVLVFHVHVVDLLPVLLHLLLHHCEGLHSQPWDHRLKKNHTASRKNLGLYTLSVEPCSATKKGRPTDAQTKLLNTRFIFG